MVKSGRQIISILCQVPENVKKSDRQIILVGYSALRWLEKVGLTNNFGSALSLRASGKVGLTNINISLIMNSVSRG